MNRARTIGTSGNRDYCARCVSHQRRADEDGHPVVHGGDSEVTNGNAVVSAAAVIIGTGWSVVGVSSYAGKDDEEIANRRGNRGGTVAGSR